LNALAKKTIEQAAAASAAITLVLVASGVAIAADIQAAGTPTSAIFGKPTELITTPVALVLAGGGASQKLGPSQMALTASIAGSNCLRKPPQVPPLTPIPPARQYNYQCNSSLKLHSLTSSPELYKSYTDCLIREAQVLAGLSEKGSALGRAKKFLAKKTPWGWVVTGFDLWVVFRDCR